jgi:hypothetical protein
MVMAFGNLEGECDRWWCLFLGAVSLSAGAASAMFDRAGRIA